MADNLLPKIQTDLKVAQLARDEVGVSTLRLLLSEIKNREISKGGDLADPEIIAIIQKEVKKRNEAAAGFRSGGREEAALKEEHEAKILTDYLPQQMNNEELTRLVEETITELGAAGAADIGKVMGTVMGKAAGRADGGIVSGLVKERLL